MKWCQNTMASWKNANIINSSKFNSDNAEASAIRADMNTTLKPAIKHMDEPIFYILRDFYLGSLKKE